MQHKYMPPNISCTILQFSDINKILTELKRPPFLTSLWVNSGPSWKSRVGWNIVGLLHYKKFNRKKQQVPQPLQIGRPGILQPVEIHL